MLDRTIAPQAHALEVNPLPHPKWTELSNHIPVCWVQAGSQEVMEIQLVLPAGYSFDLFPGVTAAAARLLTEGTQHYTSKTLSETLDFYGSFFQTEIGYEQSTLSISALSKYAEPVIALFAEILLRPTFPTDEIEQWQNRMLQRFEVEEQKTSYMASRIFKKRLLGEQHPYAWVLDKETVQHLTQAQLIQTWTKCLQPGMGYLMVVGKFDEEKVLQYLEKQFASCPLYLSKSLSQTEHKPLAGILGSYTHTMPHTLQSSIRCGSLAVPYSHPDKYKLSLLGTVFGGFFGSRLMKNIREDKGYTYGIFGDFLLMKHAGYLLIGTDVANEFVPATLEEIQKEMQKLKNEYVTIKELDVARNYMLGNLISRVETPFQMAEQIKSMRLYQLPIEEWQNQFHIIQQTTPEEILEMAQKYFHPEKLSIVVAGA